MFGTEARYFLAAVVGMLESLPCHLDQQEQASSEVAIAKVQGCDHGRGKSLIMHSINSGAHICYRLSLLGPFASSLGVRARQKERFRSLAHVKGIPAYVER